MPVATALAQLTSSKEFERLDRLAKRPNLFQALGRTLTETWHSAFLGWLLDPQGSHGLSSFPLVQLLTVAAARRQTGTSAEPTDADPPS